MRLMRLCLLMLLVCLLHVLSSMSLGSCRCVDTLLEISTQGGGVERGSHNPHDMQACTHMPVAAGEDDDSLARSVASNHHSPSSV